MNPSVCIFGFGYSAEFLAKKLEKFNFKITGTSRDIQRCKYFACKNYHLVSFEKSAIEIILKQATHILICTPPSEALGDPVLAYCESLLLKYARQFQWVGYLSSTGIYGDYQGQWVNELSLPQKLTRHGQLRLIAEQAWQHFAEKAHLPLSIFRVAGIYGPGRNILQAITIKKKNYSIYKEGQFFSRIHVEDIANILSYSMQKTFPSTIYNLADDLPAPSHVVDQFATQLLNVAPLPLLSFEKVELHGLSKEFYSANRRVSNEKIKREMCIKLIYPTYQHGLQQIFNEGSYKC